MWRATLMAAIYFGAQLWDHKRSLPANVAALAAAMLFSLQPLQVVDAGFALTFGATIGIIIGMSKLHRLVAMPHGSNLAFALLAASIMRRGRPASCQRGRLFARDRRRPPGELCGDSTHDRRANRGNGARRVHLRHSPLPACGPAGSRIWGVEGLINSAGLVDVMPWLTRRVPRPFAVARRDLLRRRDCGRAHATVAFTPRLDYCCGFVDRHRAAIRPPRRSRDHCG